MPLKHDSLADLFDDIADAIRSKTGGSAPIVADDFPDAIDAISGGGGVGGGSVVVWDELDSHGGTIRHIEADDVYGLEQGSATPSTSQQTVNPSSGNYFSSFVVAAVPEGTEGTPAAVKGAVEDHEIEITPSVTNLPGLISGGVKEGVPVKVIAAELVSGSETKTQNGTYDVTNLEELVVAVPPPAYSTIRTGSGPPSSSLGVDGDIYIQTS